MLRKIINILFLTFALVTLLSACSTTTPSEVIYEASEPDSTKGEDDGAIISLEELATFDGQNGNLAYVAIDGIVYDVSGIPAWTDGKHNGNVAGKDLTEAIKSAPHGTTKLDGLTIIGKLAQ